MVVSLVWWCLGRGCSVAVVPARSFAKPVLVAAVRTHTPTGNPDTVMRDHADKARRPQAPTRTRTDADKAPTPARQHLFRDTFSPRDPCLPPGARLLLWCYIFDSGRIYRMWSRIYSPRTHAHPHRRPQGTATPFALSSISLSSPPPRSARHLPPPGARLLPRFIYSTRVVSIGVVIYSSRTRPHATTPIRHRRPHGNTSSATPSIPATPASRPALVPRGSFIGFGVIYWRRYLFASEPHPPAPTPARARHRDTHLPPRPPLPPRDTSPHPTLVSRRG
ncbi:hypothetical protein C8R43DRAFT_616270 [Mycena crocata]|nr:hypothetical protein C8R43DRAFT_616270 [Mycena crocata]